MVTLSSFNVVAVLAATVAAMVLGMIWYSPAVFGKKWMELVHMNPGDAGKDMGRSFGIGIAGTLLQALVLSVIYGVVGIRALQDAFLFGSLLWLALIVPSELSGIAWEKRPAGLLWINGGWSLAAILLMSAVLVTVG